LASALKNKAAAAQAAGGGVKPGTFAAQLRAGGAGGAQVGLFKNNNYKNNT